MSPLYLLLLFTLSIASASDQILEQAARHYQKGEYSEAEELLSRINEESAITAEAKLLSAKCHLKTGKWDKAVKAMEKAVRLEPSNATYRLWLGRAYGENADHRKWPLGDARRCIEQFEKAAELSPENINIRFDMIEYYLQAPGWLGGDKDKARREAEVISRLQPVRAYIARAMIFEDEKEWDLAKKELTQATLDFPNEADTHKDLAQFLFDREYFEESLAAAKKALELNSVSRRSRIIMAASQVQLGVSLEEAEKGLSQMAAGPLDDEDPSFEEVYFWLGVCNFKQNEKDKSRNAFRSVLKYNPKHEKAKEYLDRMR